MSNYGGDTPPVGNMPQAASHAGGMLEGATDGVAATPAMPRRAFLRGLAAGTLALGAGELLAGCGGGGSPGNSLQPSTSPSNTTVPFRLFVSTFLGATIEDVRVSKSGVVTRRTFARFNPDPTPPVRGPETTAGVIVAPNNNLFVCSPGSDRIFLLDRTTGARKRTIEGPFLKTGHDGAIGPDGKLYVVNAPSLNADPISDRPDTVERFDASTGDHLDTFISSRDHPELRGPFAILWGPDGDLYIASVLAYGFNPTTFPFRPDHVSRFDGKTGAFKGFVVRQGHLSFTMAFLPDGRLLVPSHFFSRIYEYNIANAHLDDAFVDVGFPVGIKFGPDGDLYVGSFSDQSHIDKLTDIPSNNDKQAQGAGKVQRFDRVTGRPKGTLVSGLPFAGFLAFDV